MGTCISTAPLSTLLHNDHPYIICIITYVLVQKPSVRKVQSLQQFPNTYSSGNRKNSLNSSDYPVHSRKVLTVVDQEVIQSQMPEHVTVAEPNTNSSGRPPIQTPHHVQDHRRVRPEHAYEDVDLSLGNTDLLTDNLRASVKRSKWSSPGTQKHPKDKVRNDKPHAKIPTKDKSEASHQSIAKRKSAPVYTIKNSRGSTMDGYPPGHVSTSQGQGIQRHPNRDLSVSKSEAVLAYRKDSPNMRVSCNIQVLCVIHDHYDYIIIIAYNPAIYRLKHCT